MCKCHTQKKIELSSHMVKACGSFVKMDDGDLGSSAFLHPLKELERPHTASQHTTGDYANMGLKNSIDIESLKSPILLLKNERPLKMQKDYVTPHCARSVRM